MTTGRGITETLGIRDVATVTLLGFAAAGGGLFGDPLPSSLPSLEEPPGEHWIRVAHQGPVANTAPSFELAFEDDELICLPDTDEDEVEGSLDDIQGSPLAHAQEYVGKIDDTTVRAQAKELIDRLRVELSSRDLSGLPPVMAAEDSSGACVIEWSVAGQRLGFGVETQPEDSGWFFIGSRASGRASAYGHMALLDLPYMLDRLLGRT